MDQLITIPAPQRRYLEPYRNRTFQFDTKNSNLFLSHYVNGILNVVGDNVIVRGLDVTPNIIRDQKGVELVIEPGALIQDLTYFEFPLRNKIIVDDVTILPGFYLIVYTNWKYLQTIYENPLKIEVTFYNPKTRKTLSPWNVNTNRILLGVFNFQLDDKSQIINIEKVNAEDIVFEDTNIILNSIFKDDKTKYWTGINSTLRVGEEEDFNYLNVIPIANDLSGVSQIVSTRPNSTYELSFLIRSDKVLPFKVEVLDGSIQNYIPSEEYDEILSYNDVSTSEWKEFKLRFKALNTKSTIVFLKTATQALATFNLRDVFCVEYQNNMPMTNINRINFVDGGDLNKTLNIPLEIISSGIPIEYRSKFVYDGITDSRIEYPLPNDLRIYNTGITLVFLDGEVLDPSEYTLNPLTKTIRFNSAPNPGLPFRIAQVTMIDPEFTEENPVKRFFTRTHPDLSSYNVNIVNPFVDGTYLPFFESVLLDQDDFSISNSSNTLTLKFKPSDSTTLDIFYLNNESLPMHVVILDVAVNKKVYELDYDPDPALTLVFWGAVLLNREDYNLISNKITLNFEPIELGKLQIVTLARTESFKPKIWFFNADSSTKTYKNTSFFTAPLENYQFFYEGVLLGEDDYSISIQNQSVSFDFDFEGVSSITAICYETTTEIVISNDNYWVYKIKENESEFIIPPSLVNRSHLVFLHGTLLDKLDYLIVENRLTLNHPIPGATLIVAGFKNDLGDTVKKFDVLTTNSRKYQIELPLDYVFVFYDGKLLTPNDYSIKNNTLTLNFDPVENNLIKIFSMEA